MYQVMGKIHAGIYSALNDRSGQGTVEYVALIALIAIIVAGAASAFSDKTDIGDAVIGKLSSTIKGVGGK